MTRPAVIVGLGGTGQWVLTWLKRDLMLSNKGVKPGNVSLLELDTARRLEAGAKRVTSAGREEQAAVVGDVMLSTDEFVYLGGDSRPVAEAVAKGEYRQIGQWYHASRWLTTQQPTAFILDDGAGRLRQFGRMAIYQDMLKRNTSQLFQALQTALSGVRGQTDENRKLEIVVVGSFAGGTGSGMFIDVALILRMLAEQMNVHHVLRGFFALPAAFTDAPDTEMKARSFAAWRELNRFMVVDSDYPMPLIQYVENAPEFRIRPNRRLFDACYLVDGKRKGQPIAQEAKFGVFPMVAEVISSLLDEKAGAAYTEWISTNLAPEYAREPQTPMYSAIGAYTLQVPAHFVEERSSFDYAQAVLKHILTPRIQPDAEGRLNVTGAEKRLGLAAADQNLEDRGFAGRQRVGRLFSNVERSGNITKPTMFHSRIYQLHEQSINNQQYASLVDRLARAGGAAANNAAGKDSWVTFLPDLGGDPNFEAVRKAVEMQVNFDVRKEYARHPDEAGDAVRARVSRIPDDLRKRYGGLTSVIGGQNLEIEDYYGQCGEELNKLLEAQTFLFRRLVGQHLEDILMGRSDDALVARSGKLGYAYDMFDGAAGVMSTFLKLMDDVKKRREEIKPELKLSAAAERSKKFLAETDGKKLLFWEHPDVRKAEQGFLSDQQRLVEARREEILHVYVVRAAHAMKLAIEQARDAVERWILHLGTGDTASAVPGIWEGVRMGNRQVQESHAFDTASPGVQGLLADRILPYTEADIKKALASWNWHVQVNEGDLSISASILSEEPGQADQELADPSKAVSREQREYLGKLNQLTLLSLTRKRFSGIVASSTVAEQIKRLYPQPQMFLDSLVTSRAEPLFVGRPDSSPRVRSNLIRVATGGNADSYFQGPDGFEGLLRAANKQPRDKRAEKYAIQVVGSDNPYKLTFVRTDDLYKFTQFYAWDDCMSGYATHMDEEDNPLDPVLMQNFSAEARAVEYERRIARSGQNYRPLHPRVVMLLEDPLALRQFIYLGMLGMLEETETKKGVHWELNWTRKDGPQTLWLTPNWDPDADKTKRPRPDLFAALHGYVIMKVNREPGRRDPIDTDIAARIIEKELERDGVEGEIKLINDNLAEDGFVGWMRSQAYNPEIPEEVVRQDFADLADVVEMMLRDKVDQLTASSASARNKKPNIFKTRASAAADSAAANQGDAGSTGDDETPDEPVRRSFGKKRPS